jgi:chemotaxis family two-component system response regulator Rcp1
MKRLKILIVDDNLADVNLVKEILDMTPDCNYKADVVENGIDAIKFLNRDAPFQDHLTPHLILLDLNLPGVSGYEVLKEMTKKEINIPVIVYTTSDRPEDVRKAYKLHANSYVVKRPDFEDLVKVIKILVQFWLHIAELPESI